MILDGSPPTIMLQLGRKSDLDTSSVPIPKFAKRCRRLSANFGIKRDTSATLSARQPDDRKPDRQSAEPGASEGAVGHPDGAPHEALCRVREARVENPLDHQHETDRRSEVAHCAGGAAGGGTAPGGGVLRLPSGAAPVASLK